ncbi:hypothetical protein AgCh_005767 [Apium graveolens]
MRLTTGSTAADAARRACIDGKLLAVNGHIVLPNTQLKDGDVIELRKRCSRLKYQPRFEIRDELGWRNVRGLIGMVYVDGFADKVTCGMAVDLHHGSIRSDSRWKMQGIIAIVPMEPLVVDARDFVDGYAVRMKNGSLELLEVTIRALVILKSWKNEMNGFLFEGMNRRTDVDVLMVTIQPDLEYWVEGDDCWG